MAESISMPGVDAYINKSSLSSSTAIVGKDASQLGMDDFFNLLVAQLQNQDMFNTASDTEFVAQMAQFTTLRGLEIIQEYQLSSYAASYVGKNVVIAHTGDNGTLTRTQGVVSGVTFYDGEPKVVVEGISYPLYSVMEVVRSGSSGSMSQSEAAAYIGKTVTLTITETNEDGEKEKVQVSGKVTGVTLVDGEVHVILDDDKDKTYPAAEITGVS